MHGVCSIWFSKSFDCLNSRIRWYFVAKYGRNICINKFYKACEYFDGVFFSGNPVSNTIRGSEVKIALWFVRGISRRTPSLQSERKRHFVRDQFTGIRILADCEQLVAVACWVKHLSVKLVTELRSYISLKLVNVKSANKEITTSLDDDQWVVPELLKVHQLPVILSDEF